MCKNVLVKKISQAFIVACLLLVGCTDSESTSARVELAETEVFLDQNQKYFLGESNYYEFSESDSRCILADLVDTYKIAFTEQMLLSGQSDRSAASAFTASMIRCVDMIDLFRLDLFKREVSFSYLDCVTESITEEDVRNFLISEWVEGNKAFNKRLDDRALLYGCGSPYKEMAMITDSEKDALVKTCGQTIDDYEWTEHRECRDMVDDARGNKTPAILSILGKKIRDYPLRGCSYEEIKSWIQEKLHNNPEWPLIVEKECN